MRPLISLAAKIGARLACLQKIHGIRILAVIVAEVNGVCCKQSTLGPFASLRITVHTFAANLRDTTLARLENRIRDPGGVYRCFDVVSANDVRALQDQRNLRGKGSVEAGFGRDIFAISRQGTADEGFARSARQ